ncbi:cell envelope integrity EipB family protein [Rhodopila sp.]|jgi:hypothetical protein|uniref:cell envelope integrity EipB family protein n=1 Tax=Rhodopila sp. TaxID=2480087 RepID=UPI002C1EEE27|nr:cell envelope integrity EipB family protein [Rhodopila sp.]HVZ09289.1 cell envelope integrity EipB family protein [Rhodopila sp.]
MRLSAAFLTLLLVGAAPVAEQPALAASAQSGMPAAVPLAAHKALYGLTLAKTNSTDVIAARGTMGYEVTDACDGWATRQRLQMTVTNADGQDIVMTSDYTTWEAKNGLKFRFHVRQTTEQAITSQTDGDATLTKLGGPGEARYTSPQQKTVPLPAGTMFPMMHTAAIINAAREKQRFLAIPLFDGTDDSGVEDSFIVILDWKPPMPTKWPALSALPSTRVQLSFFDHDETAMTPSYQVGMRYWENGVADAMKMDFGDFVMDAKMTEFTLQPHRC